MINELVQQFNGAKTSEDTVAFSSGGPDFTLTDGTQYQVVDGHVTVRMQNGGVRLLPFGTPVKELIRVRIA